MIKSSQETIPIKKYCKHPKPYWNKVIRTLHKSMRELRTTWCRAGKPRNDITFNEYKTSKRIFRRELRRSYMEYVTENTSKIDTSVDVDQNYVWSEIRNKDKSKQTCAKLIVNDSTLTSPEAICDGWATHFETIFSESAEDEELFGNKADIEATVRTFRNSNSTSSSDQLIQLDKASLNRTCNSLKTTKLLDPTLSHTNTSSMEEIHL